MNLDRRSALEVGPGVAPALAGTLAAVMLLLSATLPAHAAVITEFSIPSSFFSFPAGIAAGPDDALWFAQEHENKIGRITTAGVITQFEVPTANSSPENIVAGPDGNLWFTEGSTRKIGRITTAGVVTEFVTPSGGFGITAGPDGALWYTGNFNNTIGRITTAGISAEFPIPTVNSGTIGIVTGPDGALWFTEKDGNKIGRITTAGVVTEFPIPTAGSAPWGIAAGSDGALWFTESLGNKIGRITTAGVITEFPIPTVNSFPHAIVAGPDGALWFTEATGNKIGRITTAGVITEFTIPTPNSNPHDGIAVGSDGALWFTEHARDKIGRLGATIVAAVLPLSRSVQVGVGSTPAAAGTPATAFAAIINTGTATVLNCAPAPPSNPPAGLGTFTYQTTDVNNSLIGPPNTPANIAPGAIQNFVFGFSPTAPIAETSLAMRFVCEAGSPQTPGVNNFFIVADTSPVPDTIALMATISGDGVVRIPGSSGIQLFAMGTSNVGATGTIVVSGDDGGAGLPLTLTVCETNTATGACMLPPTPTVTVNYTGGSNRSFAFFAQASGSIPFDPANKRVFARLRQQGTNVLRGATSAAVCTQPNAGC